MPKNKNGTPADSHGAWWLQADADYSNADYSDADLRRVQQELESQGPNVVPKTVRSATIPRNVDGPGVHKLYVDKKKGPTVIDVKNGNDNGKDFEQMAIAAHAEVQRYLRAHAARLRKAGNTFAVVRNTPGGGSHLPIANSGVHSFVHDMKYKEIINDTNQDVVMLLRMIGPFSPGATAHIEQYLQKARYTDADGNIIQIGQLCKSDRNVGVKVEVEEGKALDYCIYFIVRYSGEEEESEDDDEEQEYDDSGSDLDEADYVDDKKDKQQKSSEAAKTDKVGGKKDSKAGGGKKAKVAPKKTAGKAGGKAVGKVVAQQTAAAKKTAAKKDDSKSPRAPYAKRQEQTAQRKANAKKAGPKTASAGKKKPAAKKSRK